MLKANPTLITGATPAAKTERRLRLLWWIGAPRSIRCIPIPPIHHQARIHHGNFGVNVANRTKRGEA
jgi:hypothetical protein